MKSSFETQQSAKILTAYLDIKKGGVPDGTVSKDGTRVKKNGQWKWIRKDPRLKDKDIAVGQSYQVTDQFGKRHSTTYTVKDIDEHGIHLDETSTEGRSGSSVMSYQDFMAKVGSKFSHEPTSIKKKFNPDHFSSPQQYLAAETALNGGVVTKDLDYNSLPKNVKDQLIAKFKSLPKFSNSKKFDIESLTPSNYQLFKDSNRTDLLPKVTQDSLAVFGTDKNIGKYFELDETKGEYKPLTNLAEIGNLLRGTISTKWDYIMEHNDQIAKVLPKRVLDAKPLQLYGGKQALLGDYIELFNNRISYSYGNLSDIYRITEQFKTKKGEDAWKLKNSKGETKVVTSTYWDSHKAKPTEKENSLLKN